ncbi:hypothetical protein BKA69DRAFT_1137877 [Paraphysoderma sedebokerense]|nr:hypothetical protein BKA69DRAFT_1137877 [Paraphysoderma sedebokerense]
MEVKSSIGIGNSSAVKVLWHSKINQILVGTGAGHVHVFYDPHVSVRGAKLCVSKGRKVRHIDEMDDTEGKVGTIITPHALPMFKETATLSGASNKMTKRKRDKLRKDPVASRMPERPITGPGRGGQIGTNELQIMMKSIIKDTSREEDPREAILRHAQAAAEDPYWIAPAYKKTQPKAVLAEKVSDEEEEEEEEGSGMEKKRKILD